jgi:D-threo-aldose 1-dehydrogenase
MDPRQDPPQGIQPNIQRSIKDTFILGCSGLAGLMCSVSEEEVVAIIKSAVFTYGIERFDTAPHYGCGLGEERLGRALLKVLTDGSTVSDEIGIAGELKIHTKVGRVILPQDVDTVDPNVYEIEFRNLPGPSNTAFPDTPSCRTPVRDYSSAGIVRSYEDSMARLQINQLQTHGCTMHGLRLHDFDDPRHLESVRTNGGLSTLIHLRDDRKCIRDVSIGDNRPNTVLDILSTSTVGQFNSVMLANSWNLLDHPRESQEVFERCGDLGIEIQLAGVFASGALVGKDSYHYSSITDPSVTTKLQKWQLLCHEYNIPLPVVAIAFSLLLPTVSAIAIGVSSVGELDQVMLWFKAAITKPVPSSLWSAAKEQGLLSAHISG